MGNTKIHKTIRLDADLFDQIYKLGKKLDRSPHYIMIQAIKKGLKEVANALSAK